MHHRSRSNSRDGHSSTHVSKFGVWLGHDDFKKGARTIKTRDSTNHFKCPKFSRKSGPRSGEMYLFLEIKLGKKGKKEAELWAPKTWNVAIYVIYNFFMLWKCKYIRLLLQFVCFPLFIFFLTSFFSQCNPGFRPSPRTPSAKSPNKLETFSPDRFSGPRTPKKTSTHIPRILLFFKTKYWYIIE